MADEEILTEAPDDEGNDQEAAVGAHHEVLNPEEIQDAPEHEVEEDETESD